MRQQTRIAVGQAKEDTGNKVPVEHMHIVVIVDFCQNVQLPSHKKDQPGETYFFVPLNIFVLGIVDCNSKKDHLHAYMYTEAEGGKGGNLVASLIMKYLFDQGLLDGQQRYKLTIIMDNCTGQNKNKMVLRLAPYLTMKNHFEHVSILFLVAGHTKNTADRLFNLLKKDYRCHNVFSLTELIRVCNINQYVSAYKCIWTDFYNWDTFLNKIFQPKLEAIKKYQLFEACHDNEAIVKCLSLCLPDSVIYDDDLSKTMTVNAVQKVLSSTPDKLYKKPIGLRDIKAVGLRENYADLIDVEYHEEMCPMPPLEV